MATIFTHGFVGAALAATVSDRIPRWPLFAMAVILAIVPDFDVIAFNFGIPYAHPLGHRGFTHSIVFALVLGPAAALLFYRFVKPFSGSWWVLSAVFALAMLSHGLLDALTDAGLGVGFFIPFSNERFFFPWRPLETSPIGIEAFFTRRAWEILANEALWVGLPTGLLLILRSILNRDRRRPSSDHS